MFTIVPCMTHVWCGFDCMLLPLLIIYEYKLSSFLHPIDRLFTILCDTTCNNDPVNQKLTLFSGNMFEDYKVILIDHHCM